MSNPRHTIYASLSLAATLAIAIGGSVAFPVLSMEPPNDGLVLVIVPPWRGGEDIVRGAGGYLVGPVQAPMAVLARFNIPVPIQSMRNDGAWAVLDGTQIAFICGVSEDA